MRAQGGRLLFSCQTNKTMHSGINSYAAVAKTHHQSNRLDMRWLFVDSLALLLRVLQPFYSCYWTQINLGLHRNLSWTLCGANKRRNSAKVLLSVDLAEEENVKRASECATFSYLKSVQKNPIEFTWRSSRRICCDECWVYLRLNERYFRGAKGVARLRDCDTVWPLNSGEPCCDGFCLKAVSYTHLTLPTILLV